MRASLLSAMIAATLGITALSPTEAQAQVVIYPTINTSPYVNASYWYPYSNYAYSYAYPMGTASYWGWSNPFNYGNYSWYSSYPNYYNAYSYWPNYGYRGWNGRWHRW